jgi:hypothetical protein
MCHGFLKVDGFIGCEQLPRITKSILQGFLALPGFSSLGLVPDGLFVL